VPATAQAPNREPSPQAIGRRHSRHAARPTHEGTRARVRLGRLCGPSSEADQARIGRLDEREPAGQRAQPIASARGYCYPDFNILILGLTHVNSAINILAVAGFANSTTVNSQEAAGKVAQARDRDGHRGRRFAVPKPTQDGATHSHDALVATAAALYESWKQRQIDWEEYATGDVTMDETSYDVLKLLHQVDVLGWFKANAPSLDPSLLALARIHLGRPISTAYQERFFSVAGNILSSNRTRFDDDRVEELQLLKHNWSLHVELARN